MTLRASHGEFVVEVGVEEGPTDTAPRVEARDIKLAAAGLDCVPHLFDALSGSEICLDGHDLDAVDAVAKAVDAFGGTDPDDAVAPLGELVGKLEADASRSAGHESKSHHVSVGRGRPRGGTRRADGGILPNRAEVGLTYTLNLNSTTSPSAMT